VPPAQNCSPEISPQVVVGNEEIFEAHVAGKLSVELKAPLDTQRALSIAYTPGVAQVSRAIAADRTLAARYTWANRLVAVVSDGSAVLGLGDIGPAAALPVMEGKSALFKAFGGLDSIPIVLDTKDPDEIIETLVSAWRTSPRRAASRSNVVPSKRWTAR
jgi:malate dehydrogenase (oxaloacetate-decarboxylating)